MCALSLFGGEIGSCSHDSAGLGETRIRGRSEGAGDAEVSNLQLTARTDQDVSGLDVAVHHIVAVGERQGGRDFDTDFGSLHGTDGADIVECLCQGSARDVLHRHEIGVLAATPVVHADDVGVIEIRCRLSLSSETFDEQRIGCVFGEENLDGDEAVEKDVAREIDLSHTATADALLHLVAVVHQDCAVLGHIESGGYPRAGEASRRALSGEIESGKVSPESGRHDSGFHD